MKFIFSKLKFFIAIVFVSVTFSNIVQAANTVNQPTGGLLQGSVLNDMNSNTNVLQNTAGYAPNVTIGSAVATVINGFLALLGVIFVILIILAGYNWMSAAGDEEKITKAKDTLRAAVIGLIIIVAAYSITYFVFQNLPGGGGEGTIG